ncbi:RDD family protein [Dyella terrae]|uniref:RDD family protein n=1 Tax=Dyella terrae TaxID=522259 RepID=UPI001EFD7ADB|nr:RDD family protein [Dyella terrae]
MTDAARQALEAEVLNRENDDDSAKATEKVRNFRIKHSSLASIEARIAAQLIDVLLPLGVTFLVSYGSFITMSLSYSNVVGEVSLALCFVYWLFKDGFGGQSIGKKIMKIQVIEHATGSACSPPRSLIRAIPMGLGIIDCAFALGKERRRLGDMAAGTSVIRAGSGSR